VRRKVSASATEASALEPVFDVEPNEAEPVGEAVVLDVVSGRGGVSPKPVSAEPEPEPAPVAAPGRRRPPKPEIDVAALIADDPNQIVAPPEKPKRGWWRR
jgi:ribonuclease E